MKFKLNTSNRAELLKRPLLDERVQDQKVVQDILNRIKLDGLIAVKEFAQKFDNLKSDNIRVPVENIKKATSEAEQAIRASYENLRVFHLEQFPRSYQMKNNQGVEIGVKWRPLNRVGFTIPGGTAPLVSTVLMLGIPAQIAGVKEVVLITPADCPASISEDILFAANLCGVEEVYCIGGAQGIGALAYGCEELSRVDKIFGPGSYFVDQAKRYVSIDTEGAAIDMPAGPSEVLVIADNEANHKFIASDLLAQLEHGVDSQAILLSTSSNLIEKVELEVLRQARALSRFSILKESVKNVQLIEVNDLEEAVSFSEEYAPEHLIVQTNNPEEILEKTSNAGSIFLGSYTPETLGDYLSGTNHVLPTSGFARSSAGLGVVDFMRKVTYQKASREALLKSKEYLKVLTNIEGLDGHYNAVVVRLGDDNDS